MEGNLKCPGCGAEFPVEDAKCKTCRGPMRCEEDACVCDGCGKTQPAKDMWCDACLKKND
jgi:hypothetical protein